MQYQLWPGSLLLATDHVLEDINCDHFPQFWSHFISSPAFLRYQKTNRDCFKGLGVESIIYLPASFSITDTMMRTVSVASMVLPFLSFYAAAVPATLSNPFPRWSRDQVCLAWPPWISPPPSCTKVDNRIYLYLAVLPVLTILIEQPAPLRAGLYTLAADFDAFCGGGRNDAALVDDVIACFNYLTNLGHQNCVVPTSGVTFCTAGTAQVNGEPYDTSNTVSSYW